MVVLYTECQDNIWIHITNIPFGITDWSLIEPTTHNGDIGYALWRTQYFDDIRVRMMEYSVGYIADHWCKKGHILLCLKGKLITELDDGRIFILTPGMSYQVAGNAEAHRSSAPNGATLFIVDWADKTENSGIDSRHEQDI